MRKCLISAAISLSLFGIIYSSQETVSQVIYELNGRIYETDSARSYYIRLADKTEKDFFGEAVRGDGIEARNNEWMFEFRQILRKYISKERRKKLSGQRLIFSMVFQPDMSVAAIRIIGIPTRQLYPGEIDMIDSAIRKLDFNRYLSPCRGEEPTKPFCINFPAIIDTLDINDRSFLKNHQYKTSPTRLNKDNSRDRNSVRLQENK